jgi:hypothetical protein
LAEDRRILRTVIRDYLVIAGIDLAAFTISVWAQLSAEFTISILAVLTFSTRMLLR